MFQIINYLRASVECLTRTTIGAVDIVYRSPAAVTSIENKSLGYVETKKQKQKPQLLLLLRLCK